LLLSQLFSGERVASLGKSFGLGKSSRMTETNKAVFLSYASQDADAARRICEALRGAGVEVWFLRLRRTVLSLGLFRAVTRCSRSYLAASVSLRSARVLSWETAA
jgi:hypothetical protein